MINRVVGKTVVCIAALANMAPGSTLAAQPAPQVKSAQVPAATSDGNVSTTLLPGSGRFPLGAPPPAAFAQIARPGPVTLHFPSVDVQDFAKAVLGDVLHLPYAVDPMVHGVVTLMTTHSVAREDVLPMVEEALRTSGLALEPRGGVYTITSLGDAKAAAPAITADQEGFGNETLTLHYANPVELQKLIDPVIPGVITSVDAASGTMTLSGPTGQRRAVREFAQQFDMDWLKGMSFALFVPKNTDARLIAPELDKLINAPGSTVAGLVRLVAMDKLNGIIAIAPQAQYLDDVRRWVEVLDREGASTERRLYVYHVQNGRASDLANVLISAFGGAPSNSSSSSGQKRGGFATAASSVGSSSFNGASGAGASPAPASLYAGLTAATSSDGGRALPGQSPSAVAKPPGVAGAGDALVITADETNNAVVAYATPREFTLIEDALRKLDITPLQVVIEVAISEVTLNDTLQYGTQWFFQTHGNQYGLTQSTTSTTPIQTFPGFSYTAIAGGAIAATLTALSSVTHVEVLSAPNLLVLNNQTASLQVGDQVPISTGSAVSTVSAGAPVVNSVDYKDVGVILQITPRVNNSGLVLLDISQEVSQVDTTSSASADNPIKSPVISERKIASSIAVQDGRTIALGGLISDNNSKTRSGIPILSAIPFLGALTGNRNGARQRTELLVLLTPKVIRSPTDAQAITDELKQQIRWIKPLPPKFEP